MRDFFSHQQKARRYTGRLIVLMSLAVLVLVGLSTLITAMALSVMNTPENQAPTPITLESIDPWLVGIVALVVIGGIALFSSIKLWQLRTGGPAVAHALGGTLIAKTTRDPDERKVLNIVEEMALASSMPVPPVYIMEEAAINAFAAGHSVQTAAVGVTRGAIKHLNRAQLQGVMAHEFSHIANGDMRLNLRLVSLLHGILFIGLAGQMLIRVLHVSSVGSSTRTSSGKKGNAVGIIVLLGVGLIVLGYAGTFFGRLIQAAVSRQREYLADASAVQYTRDPSGIASALRTIRDHAEGSQLQSPKAAQFNHMFFDHHSTFSLLGLLATHPPLDERIRRLQPGEKTK